MDNDRSATASAFPVAEWGARKIVWVDSDRIEQSIQFYHRHRLDGIGINPLHGYRLGDVEFLRKHSDVTGLVVVPSTKEIDISALGCLEQLKFLSLSDNTQSVDLDAFPRLAEYRGDWHKKLRFTEASVALRSLHLWKYRPTSSDLSQLPRLAQLKELGLTQTSVRSLNGLEHLRSIETLDVAYARNLANVDALIGSANLETIIFENCPKLSSPEVIARVGGLRVLRLNACGDLPSLSFLDSLLKLEEFRFVNTNVLDGNLTPLMRLKRVGFLNKKHFSHTYEAVAAALEKWISGPT